MKNQFILMIMWKGRRDTMDKFIKLLDLLRKDKPLAVHICFMGGGDKRGALQF